MASEAKGRFGLVAVPVALVGILVAALGTSGPEHEGRKYVPYLDSGGVLTVCGGITGKDVVKGRRYTEAECDKLESAYVVRMFADMGQCVRGQFTAQEAKAWGHFAYNVGTDAFCRSTAAKRLNAGERKAACAEISKWVFVNGKDCRKAASNCGGIVKRRAWERAECEAGAL